MKQSHHHTEAQDRKYYQNLVAGFSETNRDAFTRWLRQIESQRLSLAYLKNMANGLRRLDLALEQASAAQATSDQLTRAIIALSRDRNPTTINGLVSTWRMFYRNLYGQIPHAIDAALTRQKVRQVKPRPVVTEEEYTRLLHASVQLPGKRSIRTAALIVTLRATGMRIGELCACVLDSWRPQDDGSAIISLPDDAYGLKTGPRDVVVRKDYRPAIDLWIEHHPQNRPGATNGQAPLFPTDDEGTRMYWPQNANALLHRLAASAGIRPIHPHLFRHTWATWAAKNGVPFQIAAQQLGWSQSSKMAKVYYHMTVDDVRNWLAGTIPSTKPTATYAPPPPAAKPTIDDELRQALARILLGGPSAALSQAAGGASPA
ncbi:MAG: site-specific integrase [Euryarchaeota archaeon]|nr:site-specific integrase [Euryarchaeota archaeon]